MESERLTLGGCGGGEGRKGGEDGEKRSGFVKEDEGRRDQECASGAEAESEGGSEIPCQNLLLNFQV